MSNFGIGTLNSLAQINFLSNNQITQFPKATYVTSGALSIPSDGFASVAGIATPNSPFRLRMVTNAQGTILGFEAQIGGIVNAAGTQYIPAANAYPANYTSNHVGFLNTTSPSWANLRRWFTGYPVVSVPSTVATLGSRISPSDTFGLTVRNTDGGIQIDPRAQTYYVHPDASGQKIRTATATSVAGFNGVSSTPAGVTGQFDQAISVVQNITFEQPFDEPPLIFVTRTYNPSGSNFLSDAGGPIPCVSLHHFIRNAENKFIGASVVCERNLSTIFTTAVGAWGEATPANCTFDYFIASPQEPLYITGQSSQVYGMRMFDNTGRKIFDSNHAILNSFFSLDYEIPVFRMFTSTDPNVFRRNASVPRILGGYDFTSQTFTLFGQRAGVLLNNHLSIVGHTQYISGASVVSSTAFLTAPRTYYGRYICVRPKSDGNTEVISVGAPTTSLLNRTLAADVDVEIRAFVSFDYHKSTSNQTMDLLAANYVF